MQIATQSLRDLYPSFNFFFIDIRKLKFAICPNPNAYFIEIKL